MSAQEQAEEGKTSVDEGSSQRAVRKPQRALRKRLKALTLIPFYCFLFYNQYSWEQIHVFLSLFHLNASCREAIEISDEGRLRHSQCLVTLR